MGPCLQKMAHTVIQRCPICANNNSNNERYPPGQRIHYKLKCLIEDWQIDFTQMPRTTGSFKYLLVFVDIFFGGVEVFPTQTGKNFSYVKILAKGNYS